MPMLSATDFGTNADGTPNHDFCLYCYQKGAFTRDVTMDEMVETNLMHIDQWNAKTGNNFTVEEARPILRKYLSTLKRWSAQ